MFNDEFSARLSVNSILRLRASAIAALSHDTSDSAAMSKVAERVLPMKKCQGNEENGMSRTSVVHTNAEMGEEGSHAHKRKSVKYATEGGTITCTANTPDLYASPHISDDIISESPRLSKVGPASIESSDDLFKSQTSVLVGDNDSARVEVAVETPEVFLAGLIIHIIPDGNESSTCWENWMREERTRRYKAFLSDRECFKDIVVSPFMFIDHLPWRYAPLYLFIYTYMSDAVMVQ